MTFRFRYAGKVDHEEDLLVDGAYSFLISPIFGDVPDVKVDHRKLRTRRIGIVGKFAGASVRTSRFRFASLGESSPFHISSTS